MDNRINEAAGADQEVQIYDRPYSFFIVDKSFLDDERIDHTDICTVVALKYFTHNSNMKCWPSIKTIAAKARLGERTVYRSLEKLERLGYIKRQQRFTGKQRLSSIFYFLPPPACEAVPAPQAVPPACEAVPPACEADRTRSNELDLKNYNPPLNPPKGETGAEKDPEAKAASEENPVEQLTALSSPEEEAVQKLAEEIKSQFPGSPCSRVRESVRSWVKQYGIERTSKGVAAAIGWNIENGRKRHNATRFIGNWMRRQAERDPVVERDPVADRAFDQFWAAWPGPKDRPEDARAEWHRRFASLPDREAKNSALRAVSRQMEQLQSEIVEQHRNPMYIGAADKFIRGMSLRE
ncbi:helix-turn-helix domain-containing protein [Pyramidobacter piscolens]|uniref:helix-turn-helix domain-containing protein n=1 Tax=Pyramidobacter piscolens TaxID=638849 RepID=UPI0024920B36|nr:helix-turn-helix domain-containing protein [Pyramidobacter piscolens]